MKSGICSLAELSSTDYAARLCETPDGAMPFAGTMEINTVCNLRCRHCYLSDAAPESLPREHAVRLINIMADSEVLCLAITGGEPLLHPAFRAIHAHAHASGLLVSLLTNCTLVDASLASFLADHPPRRVEASMYGTCARTYENVTGTPGSFDRFHAGLAMLRKAGIRVQIKYPIMRGNFGELDDARAWASAEGLPFRSDPLIVPTLQGSHRPTAERIPPADAAALIFPDGGQEHAEPGGTGAAAGSPLQFNCGAGTRTFLTDARGFIHPCPLWRRHGYDLANGSVVGWRRTVERIRMLRWPTETRCAACAIRSLCAVCPALSALENGEPGRPVEYLCRGG